MSDSFNVVVTILSVFYPHTGSLDDTPAFVKFLVKIATLENILTLPIDQFNAATIQRKFPLLRFHSRGARASFDKTIVASLLDALEHNAVPRGYHFDRNGAALLPNGETCFIRGAELIGKCDLPYIISPNISQMRLLGSDAPLSKLPALLLTAPPQVLLVFAYVILSSVRSILSSRGVDIQSVLYITGGQGLGKTTLATRIAGIYEQDGKPVGIIQAGSTHSAVNAMMASLRDQPVVIDDLCYSASRNTARKRIDLASNLIRQGTGNVPIIKKVGNSTIEVTCEASLIMTAEFYLENLSDLTRCIIVPMVKPLDIPDALTPALVGSAVRHYSKWFADHMEREVEQIHKNIKSKEDATMDNRMSTNYACLEATLRSFVTSLYDLEFSPDLGDAILGKMDGAIADAKAAHKVMIEKINENRPVGNLSFCILEGYRNGAFDLTSKLKKLDTHSGIIWKDDLCLKKESLIQFVRQQPGYHEWSPNKITRALKDINALVLQEDGGNTVHLDKSSPRVYRIRLNVLKTTAEKY